MRKYCVIGTPVGHSKSPELFERFLTERGLAYGSDAEYVRNEIKDKEQLAEFVNELKTGKWDGCNVTMPWKTDMAGYMDELSETAKITEAVNTVSARNGHLYGDSTDGRGMLNAIANEIGFECKGKIVILGCGGAARSIIAEAIVRKTERLVIACRDVKSSPNYELTMQMLDRIGQGKNSVQFIDIEDINAMKNHLSDADVLINSTPLGMLDGRGDENRLPLSGDIEFRKELIVADCVYNPDETLLIKKAVMSGCRAVKGIRMLEEQARCGVDILLGL